MFALDFQVESTQEQLAVQRHSLASSLEAIHRDLGRSVARLQNGGDISGEELSGFLATIQRNIMGYEIAKAAYGSVSLVKQEG